MIWIKNIAQIIQIKPRSPLIAENLFDTLESAGLLEIANQLLHEPENENEFQPTIRFCLSQ